MLKSSHTRTYLDIIDLEVLMEVENTYGQPTHRQRDFQRPRF